MPSAYDKLKDRFAQYHQMHCAISILSKDAETVMAAGSGDDRTQQMVAIARAAHMLLSAPDVGQWLDAAEKEKDALPPQDRRNLHLMRLQWVHVAGLPEELAAELARFDSHGQQLHTAHGKKGDWKTMRDWYAHCFDTMRTVGDIKKTKIGAASAYEALLDTFCPGTKAADVERVFSALEKDLPALIKAAAAHQATQPAPIPLKGPFPRDAQEKLCRILAEAVGFDFNRGVLSVIDGHPSMGGSRNDARITTDADEDNFLSAVYSTVHETGHALYEQNTPAALDGQPAAAAMGMAVHESQSRIIEVQACHTPEFFRFLEKHARAVFNRPDDPALDAKNLERLVNRMEASFIRIEADELTYPAHIILRHKLEKSLIDGTLTVDELPDAWNAGMQKLLGITPPDHARGCLQDVHWPTGAVGYFPAYTLGDMGAAQFYAAACRVHPDIPQEIEKGNFKPLKEWLNKNVHEKGSLLTMDELFTQATGEPLDARHYLDHLSRRFTGQPWVAPHADKNRAAGPKRA